MPPMLVQELPLLSVRTEPGANVLKLFSPCPTCVNGHLFPDIEPNDTQHNGIQLNDIEHFYTLKEEGPLSITIKNDTQHYDTRCMLNVLMLSIVMQSDTMKSIILSAVSLSLIMLSVMVPSSNVSE